MGYRTYTCPIARRCGGCEWLAVPYPIQLERKRRLVEEQLGAALEADGGELAEIRGMGEPRAYRHKAATPFAPGKGGRLRHGFFASGSHRIVACETCLVEHPAARPVFDAVAREAARLGIPAYDEDRQRGALRHAVMRTGRVGGESLLTLVTATERVPRLRELARRVTDACQEAGLVGVVQNVNPQRGNAILGRACRTLLGAPVMHDELLGCRFEVGPTAFFQTNPEQTEVLYGLVIEALGLSAEKGEANVSGEGAATRVLDAYCGCGTIGICVAAAAERSGASAQVSGVEQVAGAVAAARRNAVANGVGDRCSFVRADATAHLARLARGTATGGSGYDAVVLDPPRAGATPAFLDAVVALSPPVVVYVSCNVVTQARDVGQLRAAGYRLELVTPVDLFAHTRHVETVAVLRRG